LTAGSNIISMTPQSDSPRDATSGAATGDPSCKVGKSAVEFGIEDTLERIVAERRQGASFRDLADEFNMAIVESALEAADLGDSRSIHAAMVGEDVATPVYRILQGNSEAGIESAELRARLSSAGVDVPRVEGAFVSHVTMRSHLQDCVGVSPDESGPSLDQIVNTIRGARTRSLNIIQSSVDRAIRYGLFDTGPLTVEMVVRATCQECGDQFYLSDLIEERQCSCSTDETTDQARESNS